MKNLALAFLVIFLGLSFMAKSQNEGKVVYEEKVKIDINLEGASEEILKMIPKEQKSGKVLYFNNESSSYQNSKEDESGIVPGNLPSGVQVFISEPDNRVFFDFKSEERIEQKEFMTRYFLIKEEITQPNWKLTGQQKMILDYPCQQAVQIAEKDTITAWFTPNIQVSSGPSEYVKLPGLILEVDVNHGKKIITAQSVELTEINKELIKKPKKGKKVSREEYKKIVEEKTKEMGGDNEGGSTIVMEVLK